MPAVPESPNASRPTLAARPWRSDEAQRYQAATAAELAQLSLARLDDELFTLVEAQERHVDEDCITLYAGTNITNPRMARLLGSNIGSRPNLGPPGDTYNRGMDHASRLEVIADELVGSLFGAAYVETRVASGSIANMYAYLATCRPGDNVLAFSDAAAGHVTHHATGAAGYCGLVTHDIAFDHDRMDVDLEAFAAQVAAIKPRLIILAGSMCLFPYAVREVRAIADTVGAYVLYDAAHMGGPIAGGRFQNPLAEGAHLMTGSTYKSLGGPASGMVLTNDRELAQRLDAIAYPGFTANFDLAKTAALALAARDMHTYGRAYADMCIANAQALALALADNDVPVFEVPARTGHPDLNGGRPFTVSQHVAVDALQFGGGTTAGRALEPANILCSGMGLPLPTVAGEENGIRLGTQEVTRWGMQPTDMAAVANLFADVLLGRRGAQTVRADVIEMRRGFRTIHFVSPSPATSATSEQL